MVRRIVSCKSCRKRFATASGSTLCLSCRPQDKEQVIVAPELKYGGDCLSLASSHSCMRRGTSATINNGNRNARFEGEGGAIASSSTPSSDLAAETNNENSTRERGDGIGAVKGASSLELDDDRDPFKMATTTESSDLSLPHEHYHQGKGNKKRKNSFDSISTEKGDGSNVSMQGVSPFNINEDGDISHCQDEVEKGASTAAEMKEVREPHISCSKRQKIGYSYQYEVPVDTNVTVNCCAEDVAENNVMAYRLGMQSPQDCLNNTIGDAKDGQLPPRAIKPKVSIGSTTGNSSGNSSSSYDSINVPINDMDERIAQESIRGSTAAKNEVVESEETSAQLSEKILVDTPRNNIMEGQKKDDDDDDDSGIICLGSTTDKEQRRCTSGVPRVSIGSTLNNNSVGCSSEDDSDEEGDEMDEMIELESMWSTKRKGSDDDHTNEMETDTGPIYYDDGKEDDDDSDIVCLGSSQTQTIDPNPPMKDNTKDFVASTETNTLDSNPDENTHLHEKVLVNLPGGVGSAATYNTKSKAADGSSTLLCQTVNESKGGDFDTNSQPDQVNSPKKDVCYICGSDLSRLSTGLRGRVAHMKRCSAKYGNTLGGRRVMNRDGDYGDEFVETGAEDVVSPDNTSAEKAAPAASNNPYNKAQQWHGDASSELELNKAMSPSNQNSLVSKEARQSKQSMLNQFFKAPVRSLTNVLMTGARQAAKGKAIVASKSASTAPTSGAKSNSGKQPYRRGQWRSNNHNRRNGSCPAFKRIPGTDFICDGFQYACTNLSQNYFLTHFHSDHYGGITKTWSDGTIYCSLPTANLVHQQLGVDKKYLHPMPMNTPTVIASRGKPVTVTLLNANHCPGAIMFLFTVGNRNILHVGDFRWHRELMMQMPQLRAFSNSSPRLDDLFLDTTYCNEKYTLPTQEEAINAAIKVAEKEMALSKKDTKMKTLFLFGSYTIGKERIYVSVAEHLKMKVYVDSRRYRILSSLEWPKERMQIFTTTKTETSLWVVPLGSVNHKQMRDYMNEANKTKAFTAPYGRVVGFRPTGWTYSGAPDKKQRTLDCGQQSKPARNLISSKTSGRFTVHGVPYSEHSSFPELIDCLRCLKPKKITPTVSVSKSEEQIELLLNAL